MKNPLVINQLIWIDEKIENKENIKFSENLKSKFEELNLIKCDSLEKGFDEILKINFELVYIIVSGRLFEKYIIKLKNNYNILKTIPLTMVYTSDNFKKELMGKVETNYAPFIIKTIINDSFINPGGICTKPKDIYNFINNFNNKYYDETNNLNQSNIENVTNFNVNLNNFFFEKINSIDNLILPTIYSKLFIQNELNDYEVNIFLESFLKINNDKNLKILIFSLIKIESIPIEIKAKFIFKIFISHSNIFEILNYNYKQSINSNFSAFIYLMYEGLKKNALNSNFSNNLYKLYFINKNEFKMIEKEYSNYLKNNDFQLPFGFIFFKHFIDFDKDKNNVLDLEKIYNYIFEPEYSFVLLEIKKNDNYIYYSYNLDSKGFTEPKNEKIYFFPFTPLIIDKISYESLGDFKIKKLILKYIDNYDEKINLFSFNDYYLNKFLNFEYSKQIINNPYSIKTNQSIDDFKQNIKVIFQMTKENYDPPPAINSFN